MIELLTLFVLIVWLIPGTVGAVLTALAIKLADKRTDTSRFMRIALGWVKGITIGGVIGEAIFANVSFNSGLLMPSWIMGWVVTGMITGLIGSWTTYKVLDSMDVSDENAG